MSLKAGGGSLDDLRRILAGVAEAEGTVRYRELAGRLGLEPPGVIQRVGELLEAQMEADAANDRPFLASVVISRTGDLPRRGFFEQARTLGRYDGPAEGPEARRFFEREYRAAVDFWGAPG